MKRGDLGCYNYLSMTKIDIFEHDRLNLKITAIHEYIHSFLTKGTLYGMYCTALYSVNPINPKHDKIFVLLNNNMIKIQETVATLIELIYILAISGQKEMDKHLQELPKPYSSYVYSYKYILNEDYAKNLYEKYKFYLEDMLGQEKMESRIKEFKSTTELKTALNVLGFMVLRNAEIALDINLQEFDNGLWTSKKQMERFLANNSSKYQPRARFNAIMKDTLPNTVMYPQKEFTFTIPMNVALLEKISNEMIFNISEDVINKYVEDNSEIQNFSELINKVKEEKNFDKPNISKIEEIESEALLYAMPYILNKENIKKTFGKEIKCVYKYTTIDNIRSILNNSEILHIHVATGEKNKYQYYVGLSSDLNKNIINNSRIDVVEIRTSIEDVLEFKELICKYNGILYFTGCDRTEHILDLGDFALIPIFINSATSIKPSKNFINKYFGGERGFVFRSAFGEVFCVKKDNIIFFQPMIPGTYYNVLRRKVHDGTIKLDNVYYYENFVEDFMSKNEFDLINCLLESYYKFLTMYFN